CPARYNATVSRPPTAMGGMKLSQKRRPGPDRIGSFTAYAFRTMVHPPITRATIASPSHVASHSSTLGCRAARNAAASAVAPTATWPQPGTAVNDPARSMVWRMKRRSSTARSRRGWGELMGRAAVKMTCGHASVKYFALQSASPARPAKPEDLERARQDAQATRAARASRYRPIDEDPEDPR